MDQKENLLTDEERTKVDDILQIYEEELLLKEPGSKEALGILEQAKILHDMQLKERHEQFDQQLKLEDQKTEKKHKRRGIIVTLVSGGIAGLATLAGGVIKEVCANKRSDKNRAFYDKWYDRGFKYECDPEDPGILTTKTLNEVKKDTEL